MDDKLKKAAQAIIVAIENFSLRCGQQNYTDTGEAWQLLDDIRVELIEAIHGEEALYGTENTDN